MFVVDTTCASSFRTSMCRYAFCISTPPRISAFCTETPTSATLVAPLTIFYRQNHSARLQTCHEPLPLLSRHACNWVSCSYLLLIYQRRLNSPTIKAMTLRMVRNSLRRRLAWYEWSIGILWYTYCANDVSAARQRRPVTRRRPRNIIFYTQSLSQPAQSL